MPFVDLAELSVEERLPGWKGRTFHSGNMTFAHFDFAAGAAIHEHCHPNEEVWNVLEGELEITLGGDSIRARPGFAAVVPPYVAHSVKAITAGKAMAVDSPTRIDSSGGRRAVIAVDFDVAAPLPQGPGSVAIPFTLRNWGKSAAAIKLLSVEVECAPVLPPPATTAMPSGEMPTIVVVEAGRRRARTCEVRLSGEQIAQVLAGTALLYVKGVVVYEDGFRTLQHRTFCQVYDRDAFDGAGGFVSPGLPGYNYGC